MPRSPIHRSASLAPVDRKGLKMSLLFVDGFDHYATADITKKYTANVEWASSHTIDATAGRRGGGAMKTSYEVTSYRYLSKVIPDSGTVIFGAAFGSCVASATFLAFYETADCHVSFRVNAIMGIEAYRGLAGTLLGSSAGGVIQTGVGFNYAAVKAKIHDTTGTVDVEVNGVSVLSLTGLDTRNGGAGVVNDVHYLGMGNGSSTTYVDDLYICNDSGSAPNNDFLGDVRVDTIYPTSDGNYSQFTPSTGVNHYALVDETSPNTTDYNDGASVGDRDSYGLGNLSALSSQTVYGVQVNAAILKDDAGAKSVATFVRSSSTDSDGASAVLGTSQVYVSQVFEQDPNAAAAWTESTVNSMEAGVKVTA
jgi:hypothetical protein